LTDQKRALNAQLAGGGNKDINELNRLLEGQIFKLQDLNQLYEKATILQKQQLIKQGFDQQLYYLMGLIEPLLSYCSSFVTSWF
jgi:hypothetical protein